MMNCYYDTYIILNHVDLFIQKHDILYITYFIYNFYLFYILLLGLKFKLYIDLLTAVLTRLLSVSSSFFTLSSSALSAKTSEHVSELREVHPSTLSN